MAVRNRTQLTTDISTYLADNTTGDISPSDLRTTLVNITDSVFLSQDSGSISASFAQTASYVTTSQTASYYAETDPVFVSRSGSFVTTSSFNSFTSSYNSGSFTGSFTGSLFGTASWANNSISSSYPFNITGSTVYTPSLIGTNVNTNNSIMIGLQAGSGSLTSNSYMILLGNKAGANVTGSGLYDLTCIGGSAGLKAYNAIESTFIGAFSGFEAKNAERSVFIGQGVGYQATNASYSTFIGYAVGEGATNATDSTFIGDYAGYFAYSASFSTFIGYSAGESAPFASCSILIGTYAGKKVTGNGIGPNNIIIGTNITLANNRKDSINIGGIIFGTGSYANFDGNPSTGTNGNGRIGINVVLPLYNLDVSGSGNFSNGLTVTGSFNAPNMTGSLNGTASWALNTISASYTIVATATGSASYLTVVTISGSSYVLVEGDSGKLLLFTTTSSVIIPGGLVTGFNTAISQEGGGQITFVPSGSTLFNRQNHTKTAGQYAAVNIICKSLNNFNLLGDTAL